MKILGESDADVSVLKGKRVAVIGYGSQGSAQALMLKDSGIDVIVGLRSGGESFAKAKADGQKVLSIGEAARQADIIHILLPDEVQAEVFDHELSSHLKSGKTLSFSHGFNIVYGFIKPPRGVDIIMVAPIGPGDQIRKAYQQGIGAPAIIAIYKDETGGARQTALALAKAMKFTKIGLVESTFEQETAANLFSEQVVLCGGLSELIKKAFETLTENGYSQEVAYFECVQQVELLARLLRERGISGMWNEVSNTAEFGGRTVGPKIIDASTKDRMKEVLQRVENGKFAKEFMKECKEGMPNLKKLREEDKGLQIDKAGERIRELFE